MNLAECITKKIEINLMSIPLYLKKKKKFKPKLRIEICNKTVNAAIISFRNIWMLCIIVVTCSKHANQITIIKFLFRFYLMYCIWYGVCDLVRHSCFVYYENVFETCIFFSIFFSKINNFYVNREIEFSFGLSFCHHLCDETQEIR